MRLASLMVLALLAAVPAHAQPTAVAWTDLFPEFEGALAAPPVTLTDGGGQLWDLQADGSVSNGTGDAFDGAMYLEVDGTTQGYVTAHLLEGGRELALVPGHAAGTLWTGRRVHVPADGSHARWIDVLYNPGDTPRVTTVTYRLGLGSDGETEVVVRPAADDAGASGLLGWVTDDRAAASGDPAVALIFGDGLAEAMGTATLQPGNDTPTVSFTVEVPAGSPVALSLFVAQRTNRADAVRWLEEFDPAGAVGRLPYPVVNLTGFGGAAALRYSGLIRGQEGDVIQLRNGNRVHGTLRTTSWTIATGHGVYTLTRDDLAGLVLGEGPGGADAAVLLDGQVLVGELRGAGVELEQASGLTIKPALRKVARVGFAVRDGEEQRLQATGDLAVLRSGDRLRGTLAVEQLELATVYGTLAIPRDRVAHVDLVADGGASHRVTTADGSTFSGVLLQPTLPFQRGEGEPLQLDHLTLASLEVPALLIEPVVDAAAPVVELVNGDRWYARPAGDTLALTGDVGAVEVALDQVRSITADPRAAGSFVVVLAGGDRVVATPADGVIDWTLTCGIEQALPAPFIRRVTVPGATTAPRRPVTLPVRLGGP